MKTGGNVLKTTWSKLVVALIAVCSMTLTFPVAAHAEPAGQYSYICISSDGSSNTLRDGEKLSNCKGTFLKKYINGQMVSSLRLNLSGTEGRPFTRGEILCMISFIPVGGNVVRVIKVGGKLASYVGVTRAATRNLTACTA